MRHIVITERGSAVRLRDGLCTIEAGGKVLLQEPMSRIASLTLTKSSSVTSDFILACSARGIAVHFIGWNGMSTAAIDGLHSHAVVSLRKSQFSLVDDGPRCFALARSLMCGKLANQRAVLLYFAKSRNETALSAAAEAIASMEDEMASLKYSPQGEGRTGWRYDLLGLEGRSANAYWRALREALLLADTFQSREGRGSSEVANQALNYGYAVLGTRVWQCIVKSGLEPYAGFLHTDRPGKASLVLDMIELFRAWAVDRNVIKIRAELNTSGISDSNKSRLIKEVYKTFKTRHSYKGKKMALETIMQRQVYALCASIVRGVPFRPFRFKW